MTYRSILFRCDSDRGPEEPKEAPGCFVDLDLDQVVASVTAGREEYDLKPFFYRPLHDADAVACRQEVLRDLENDRLAETFRTFAEGMRSMRKRLAQAGKLSYPRQKDRWVLDAAAGYCDSVARLDEGLATGGIASRGLAEFREYVAGYAGSGTFPSLLERVRSLKAALSTIRYRVRIDGLRVRVRKEEGEPDYGARIASTFGRFRQGSAGDYDFRFLDSPEMNHVEAAILETVAGLYPDTFSELGEFRAAWTDFADPAIVAFDREIQFYIAWREHVARIGGQGLPFCYPRVDQASKEVFCRRGFDLALAGKRIADGQGPPVCNDFHLSGPERVLVVTGPNQGGKTTFARTFGQLHYFAALGCSVPGEEARLHLFDGLFTHFEREESIVTLRGKLQDDLVRMHSILECATEESIVIINEIFSATSFRDAMLLGRKIAEEILQRDLLCVWVTFLDELACLSEKTVSMVASVDPGNPALRTFKIVRRPPDGLAHALAIAEKYRLTRDRIRERIRP